MAEVNPLGTPTTNYGWIKPAVGGDNNAWGGMINTDLDGIDSTVRSIQTSVPAASSTTPAMDGTAAVGVGATFARADHVHPSDTTRYAASNPSGYQTAAQVTAVVPVASAVAPSMNGIAAPGSATAWSAGDHVHPTDTSRLAANAAAGGDLTGSYPNPTLAATSVPPGSYTNATITVDGKGRLTSASSGATPVSPATVAPLMDGTAAVGVSLLYARQDHVHPVNTTLAPLASPTFTGTPAGPTATAGTSSTQLATTAFVSSAVAGPFAYSQLPAEVQNVPIAFAFPGKPQIGAVIYIPVVMAMTIPANMVGSRGYCNTASTGAQVNFAFGSNTLGLISTVQFTAGNQTSTFGTIGASNVAVGDVLYLSIGSGAGDATFADAGITIMAKRV